MLPTVAIIPARSQCAEEMNLCAADALLFSGRSFVRPDYELVSLVTHLLPLEDDTARNELYHPLKLLPELSTPHTHLVMGRKSDQARVPSSLDGTSHRPELNRVSLP